MTDQHPVNILADTITKWRTFYRKTYKGNLSEIDYIAANAAQWGADQELEACVEWLGDAPVVYNNNGDLHPGSYLRDARRSKPPSLKEQALAEVAGAVAGGNITPERGAIICKALEALPND